jgi:hypothetical protein
MMEEKEKAVLMLTIVLLRRHYHGKATMAQRFLRRREGQTVHYGLRKVLRCAAGKANLVQQCRANF